MEEFRITLRNAGKIDPEKIEDYLAVGGYSALEKVKTLPQADVIEEVKKSGLRGRGGAGFNTGLKWEFAFKTAAEQKYVVCNADEGEPGTYKDRIIMENDPHALVEGMAICGYATGADKGYIYCRGEYPYVADLLRTTIAQAKVTGKLAGFDIEVRLGAGAYVCGEETALIESIEGRRGEPRFKPPYPGVAGLWGKPTVVNNVETYATLPYIIIEGADAYKEIGAPNYPGTKVFTLTGDVQNKTFFELPTDATVRDLIYRFGGGVANGGRLRAVQIGGASGGILPESLLNTKLDFDSMAAVGASLGSGAVFVIDESRDLKEIAENTAHFFQHESCGKCVPCREGTKRIYELSKRIGAGNGSEADVELLHRLINTMQKTSLCGLGQAAGIPILTMIQHFKDQLVVSSAC